MAAGMPGEAASTGNAAIAGVVNATAAPAAKTTDATTRAAFLGFMFCLPRIKGQGPASSGRGSRGLRPRVRRLVPVRVAPSPPMPPDQEVSKLQPVTKSRQAAQDVSHAP